MDPLLILFLILLGVLAIVLITNVRIVPQATVYVIERWGSYDRTWFSGLHMKVPIIDRISKRVSIKEQVVDFNPQPVITKDNVTMLIDTVVFFQVTDAKLYTYGVERPMNAIENLTATTLRNIIGDLEFDQTLTSRDSINTRITTTLDTATDKWGIKVNRVELKNIQPPREIQDAMEKQMKAERERRESILRAEGEKKSAILVAEGKKESAILEAEGEKQRQILQAEAVREALIQKARGESEAIMLVQQATADAIRLLNAAEPSKQVLMLRSFDALQKVADGRATKLIIPNDLSAMGALATSLKEMIAQDPGASN